MVIIARLHHLVGHIEIVARAGSETTLEGSQSTTERNAVLERKNLTAK